MSTLHVASSNGDDTMTWEASPDLVAEIEKTFSDGERNDLGRIANIHQAHEIALADAEFRRIKELGYRTHKTSSPDDTANDAEIINQFDYEAAEIFGFPATVGG